MELFRRADLFSSHRDLLPEYGLSLEELLQAADSPPDPAALIAVEEDQLDFLRQLWRVAGDSGGGGAAAGVGDGDGDGVAAIRAAIADLDNHSTSTPDERYLHISQAGWPARLCVRNLKVPWMVMVPTAHHPAHLA